jgi:two-component system, OmpR family, sensor histidine kinase MtrB
VSSPTGVDGVASARRRVGGDGGLRVDPVPGVGREGQLPQAWWTAIPAHLGRVLGQLSHALRAAWAGTRRAWRRSIQLRVVTTTVALSMAVIAALGFLLLNAVRSGLLNAKEQSALSEAYAGLSAAQLTVNNSDAEDAAGVDILMQDLSQDLAQRSSRGRLYAVMVLSSSSNRNQEIPPEERASSFVRRESVPPELRDAVTQEQGQHYQYTTIYYEDVSSPPQPGLAVGAQLEVKAAGTYELYYLFPLSQEQQTLNLVGRTLALGGVFLVLLIGAIAWLVTRQVVDPVRAAARTAERLSAGRLQERMKVRGEDDLARLATSFNTMATNLQRQIRQLEDLSRVQRRFVSDVSHELRTPLTTIRMAADVLHEARTQFDPSTARAAELLQAQLDRFEALLTDLLEISRYDAGAAVLDAESIDLRDLTRRVADGALPLAERKGTAVRLDFPAYPCVAEIDSRRIERVLRNLVVNAIEHGEGREIVLRIRTDDHAVAVAVRDHGVGLRPGEAALVFNRFWRADPARARTTGGSGLGLAIALEDARLHGGWLQAWGDPGDGSQFRLTLPRRAGADLTESPIPLEPADSRRRRSGVLAGLRSATGADLDRRETS